MDVVVGNNTVTVTVMVCSQLWFWRMHDETLMESFFWSIAKGEMILFLLYYYKTQKHKQKHKTIQQLQLQLQLKKHPQQKSINSRRNDD